MSNVRVLMLGAVVAAAIAGCQSPMGNVEVAREELNLDDSLWLSPPVPITVGATSYGAGLGQTIRVSFVVAESVANDPGASVKVDLCDMGAYNCAASWHSYHSPVDSYTGDNVSGWLYNPGATKYCTFYSAPAICAAFDSVGLDHFFDIGNVEPGKKFMLRTAIYSGATRLTNFKQGVVRTAPAAGTTFSFAAAGDPQIYTHLEDSYLDGYEDGNFVGCGEYALNHGCGGLPESISAAAQMLAGQSPNAEFFLGLGDFARNANHLEFTEFAKGYAPVFGKMGLVPVLGNHDRMDPTTGEPCVAGIPCAGGPTDASATGDMLGLKPFWDTKSADDPGGYSYDRGFYYGNAFFYVIDTGHDGEIHCRQWERVQSALDAAGAAGVKFKFVALHRSPFQSSDYADHAKEYDFDDLSYANCPAIDSTTYVAEIDPTLASHTPKAAYNVARMFASKGVSAVFGAHNHAYQARKAMGVPYFIIGTGGGTLSRVNHPTGQHIDLTYPHFDGEAPPRSLSGATEIQHMEAIFGHALVNVGSETATVQFKYFIPDETGHPTHTMAPVTIYGKPDAPANLGASIPNENLVQTKLTWTDVSQTNDSYRIEWQVHPLLSDEGDTWSPLVSGLPGSATSYGPFNDPGQGQWINYRVIAVKNITGGTIESAPAKTTFMFPPVRPGAVTLSGIANPGHVYRSTTLLQNTALAQDAQATGEFINNADADTFDFALSGVGDGDLYVNVTTPGTPTTATYDCRSWALGTSVEHCSFALAYGQHARWMVVGYRPATVHLDVGSGTVAKLAFTKGSCPSAGLLRYDIIRWDQAHGSEEFPQWEWHKIGEVAAGASLTFEDSSFTYGPNSPFNTRGSAKYAVQCVYADHLSLTGTWAEVGALPFDRAKPDNVETYWPAMNSMSIKWNDATGAKYGSAPQAGVTPSVQRSNDGLLWTTLGSYINGWGTGTMSTWDTGLSCDTRYYYRIAYTTNTGTLYSHVASGRTTACLQTPNDVTVSAGIKKVKVQFFIYGSYYQDGGCSIGDGYEVHRLDASVGASSERIFDMPDPSGVCGWPYPFVLTDTDVIPGHPYSYSVVDYKNVVDPYTLEKRRQYGSYTTGLSVTPLFSACASHNYLSDLDRNGDTIVNQDFPHAMTGCGGTTGWESAAALCAPTCHVCSAAEWVANRAGGAIPLQNYWVSDALRFNAGSSGSCSVGTGATWACGAGQMLVAAPTQPDPLGNSVTWTGCGLNSTTNNYFGGCTPSAGTHANKAGVLCCCPQ